jgi:hypothetical protein
MSSFRKVRVDVFGRFRVDVIRKDGRWTAYRLGDDGKRALLRYLPLDDSATLDDVLSVLDAVFHELAEPGRELEVIELRVG